ncbi:MAG: hypothetical protein K8R25_13900 [Methanosarcinales archaeon]|nr:hypothetical protein [Methanosarcinales archaeon]
MMAHYTGEVRKVLYPGIQFVGFISSHPEQFRNNTNRLTVVILYLLRKLLPWNQIGGVLLFDILFTLFVDPWIRR